MHFLGVNPLSRTKEGGGVRFQVSGRAGGEKRYKDPKTSGAKTSTGAYFFSWRYMKIAIAARGAAMAAIIMYWITSF